jgi:hypothetical protein
MPTGPAQVKAHGSTRDAVRNFFETEARNAEKVQRHVLGLSEDDELPAYVHQEFPKAMYPEQEGGDPIVVEDEDEESKRTAEGYFASLAEAKAHYARNGEEDDDDGDEDGDILTAEHDDEAEPVHVAKKRPAVKKTAARRRR